MSGEQSAPLARLTLILSFSGAPAFTELFDGSGRMSERLSSSSTKYGPSVIAGLATQARVSTALVIRSGVGAKSADCNPPGSSAAATAPDLPCLAENVFNSVPPPTSAVAPMAPSSRSVSRRLSRQSEFFLVMTQLLLKNPVNKKTACRKSGCPGQSVVIRLICHSNGYLRILTL
jgi:hypothetical protein